MADLNKLRRKIHNAKLVLGMSAAGMFLNTSCRPENESVSRDAKQDNIENVKLKGRIAYTDAAYQVDTLDDGNKTPTMAYFTPEKNTITQTFQPGNVIRNIYSGDDATMLHELKHQRDHVQGVGTFSMGAVQYYKVCAHREIAANIVSLLAMREDYKKYGFSLENADPDFSFYDEAVKKGEINPKSTDYEDFMREMEFIANGVRDMWVKKKLPGYDADFIMMTRTFLREAGLENANPDDVNYKKSVDICYRIGGINFLNLMDKDIDCVNRSVVDADKLIASDKYSIEDIATVIVQEKDYCGVFAGDELPEFDGSMSFEQYYQYMQHVIVAKETAEAVKKDNNGRNAESLAFDRNLDLSYGTHGKIVKSQMDDKLGRVLKNSILIPKKASEEKFNSKVKEIYRKNGIDWEDNVESSLFVDSIPEMITDFENLGLGKRLRLYLADKIKQIGNANFVSKARKNIKEQVRTNYTGEPQYEQWSPKRRVSGETLRRVMDLDKMVLAPEMFEADYYNYELSSGVTAEIEELRNEQMESLYNISVQKDGKEEAAMDSLVWMDKNEISGEILAVTLGKEAILLSENGQIENISKKTGIKNVDACYWNNGIIMFDQIDPKTEESILYAVVKENGVYYKKILGHNVYDSDEKGKISVFDIEDKVLEAFEPEELKKELLNSEIMIRQKQSNLR